MGMPSPMMQAIRRAGGRWTIGIESSRPGRRSRRSERSGFGLVFGSDAILITHTVRWFLFLNNEDWHPVLIQAVGWFFTAFQATDCVITNDEHPVIQAFWKGAAFKSALDHAQALGEAEAETLQEMCIDEGLDEELGLEGPDGWYPMSLWSTKGYWRPNLPHLLRRDAGDQNA